MGDELKNANLEALLTRGPWTGREWVVSASRTLPWTLTPEEVRAYYEAIRAGWTNPLTETLHCHPGSRKADRANSLLKKANLIQFDPVTRRWVATV